MQMQNSPSRFSYLLASGGTIWYFTLLKETRVYAQVDTGG